MSSSSTAASTGFNRPEPARRRGSSKHARLARRAPSTRGRDRRARTVRQRRRRMALGLGNGGVRARRRPDHFRRRRSGCRNWRESSRLAHSIRHGVCGTCSVARREMPGTLSGGRQRSAPAPAAAANRASRDLSTSIGRCGRRSTARALTADEVPSKHHLSSPRHTHAEAERRRTPPARRLPQRAPRWSWPQPARIPDLRRRPTRRSRRVVRLLARDRRRRPARCGGRLE